MAKFVILGDEQPPYQTILYSKENPLYVYTGDYWAIVEGESVQKAIDNAGIDFDPDSIIKVINIDNKEVAVFKYVWEASLQQVTDDD